MTMVLTALAVGLGAGAGSAARYGAQLLHARWRTRRGHRMTGAEMPLGTLAVNLLGSALLGVVAALGAGGNLSPLTVAALGAGVAGGLTTFSTFAVELVLLIRARRMRTASGYATATVVLGVAAAALAFRVVASALA